MSIEFVCPECLRATLHGGTCGNTWEADCPLKIRWSCRGDFTVLSIIYLVDFVLVDLVLFRFVRHTVTNLTYLDKVLVSSLDCYLGFLILSNPKKNVSSSNYYLNFYWFCQTQPKYQQILDLTRWLGRWTIRRRWLQAFNGLPSMKIPFQVLKYLTKFENTLPCTCDRFVWIICSLTLGFMRCREWEKKTSIDLEVIIYIFDTQTTQIGLSFQPLWSINFNWSELCYIEAYPIIPYPWPPKWISLDPTSVQWSNDPMIQWPNDQMIQWSNDQMIKWSSDQVIKRSNHPIIQSSNHPGLILAYLTDALGSAFTPAMRSAIIISHKRHFLPFLPFFLPCIHSCYLYLFF